MRDVIHAACLFAAGIGLAILVVQLFALARHMRAPARKPLSAPPPMSILKPLRGVDDGLEENLASFVALDHPDYEVLLGVKDRGDAAWPVACAAAARWPARFRVVEQRGEPGLNPKVNQLITLAAAARHDLLVISDSNIRVEPGYLEEIAAHFEDPAVGLVTHMVAGAGEERLGALLENQYLSCQIAPGVVAAQQVAGQDFVVGKSMAMRRADILALGGFEAFKDVLAEDYLMGKRFSRTLGMRVMVASRPVLNVSRGQRIRDFLARRARWFVMHRHAVGLGAYFGELLLNPILFALAALILEPAGPGLALFGGACVIRGGIDAGSARLLRPGGFSTASLLLAPARDLLIGVAWLQGLLRNTVEWRGHTLRVLPGTVLAPLETAPEAVFEEA